jgi:hypothetical protein
MEVFRETLPDAHRGRSGNQSDLADRVWLEQIYLPSLSGEILFAGVAAYTDFYHRLVRTPQSFVTADPDPDVARFGSPHGHYLGTVREVLSGGATFDHISLHGLFGLDHSLVQEPPEIARAISEAFNAVRKGGTIQLGLSTNAFSLVEAAALVHQSSILDRSEIVDWRTCRPGPAHSPMLLVWARK